MENHKEVLESPPPKQPKIESTSEEEREEQIWRDDMEDMYVKQHFQSSADEFTDTVFNVSVQHLITMLPKTKSALLQLMLTDREPTDTKYITEVQAKIRDGLNSFVQAFYSALEHNSDVMLLYLKKNILNIPDGIVLPDDKVQIGYKNLVKTLQSNNAGEHYEENNTAELLTAEAEDLYEKLRQRKIQRLKLEGACGKADEVIHRLETLERVLSELDSGFTDSVRDYVLKSFVLVSDIPNGTKK